MSPENVQIKWHALYVMPRSEKKVGKYIAALYPEVEVCIPTQKQYHQWSDRLKLVEVVLFSSYVFVGMRPQLQQKIVEVPNVVRFVSFNKTPAELSQREVAIIRQIGDAEYPVEITQHPFAPGDEVEITGGKLRGLRGRVVGLNGTAKILLAIPSLGCFAKFEVKRSEVQRTG